VTDPASVISLALDVEAAMYAARLHAARAELQDGMDMDGGDGGAAAGAAAGAGAGQGDEAGAALGAAAPKKRGRPPEVFFGWSSTASTAPAAPAAATASTTTATAADAAVDAAEHDTLDEFEAGAYTRPLFGST
jgi:hypothetical protein